MLEHMSAWMLRMERFSIELVLSASSLWAILLIAETYPQPFSESSGWHYYLLARMDTNALHWVAVLALALVTKVLGLMFCLTGLPAIGLPLRCLGLGLSGLFWILAGLSGLTGNFHSLGGMPMFLLGLSAWWLLLRYPSVPKGRT